MGGRGGPIDKVTYSPGGGSQPGRLEGLIRVRRVMIEGEGEEGDDTIEQRQRRGRG